MFTGTPKILTLVEKTKLPETDSNFANLQRRKSWLYSKCLIIYHNLFKSDVDECSLDPSPCDENSNCTNNDGSYNCTCKEGYQGNGSTCEGIFKHKRFILEV